MKKVIGFFIAVTLFEPFAELRADGGAVRFSKQIGAYRITVFTSPIPLRAGPVDVSVFVQDAATGEPVSDGAITVKVWLREHPQTSIVQRATMAASTNKLFRAAVFDLPEAGAWEVKLSIDGLGTPMVVHFEMEASERLPRDWELAPWICWPAVVIALFCIHRWLVERKQRRWMRIKKTGTHRGEPAFVTLSPNQRN